MAIRVRHAPAAALVAQAGFMGGQEDLRRNEQRVALQQAELAQRAAASSSAYRQSEQARLDALAEAERGREFTMKRDDALAEREITRQDAAMARTIEQERFRGEQAAAKDAADLARAKELKGIEEQQRVAEEQRKQDAEAYKRARGALNFQGKKALSGIDAQRWTLSRSSDLSEGEFLMAQEQLNKEEAEILGNPMFQADEPDPGEEFNKRTSWIAHPETGEKVPVAIGKDGVPRVIQGWKGADKKGEEKDKDREIKIQKERIDLEVKLLAKDRDGNFIYDEGTRNRMLKQFDDMHKLSGGMPGQMPSPEEMAGQVGPKPPNPLRGTPLTEDEAIWYRTQAGSAEKAREMALADGRVL